MCEKKDLPRGLEGLRKLVGDIRDTSLWVCLNNEAERDWGVIVGNEGNLHKTLERLAYEIESERPALTEAERRVLEMWPRFEDGEPVMPGDGFIDRCRFSQTVESVDVRDGLVTLRTENGVSIQCDHGAQVVFSRPAPEVLDADGAPIEVGDTVWHEDGTELRVTGLGDEEDGETLLSVKRVSGPVDWSKVRSLSVTHTSHDSWERIESDLNDLRGMSLNVVEARLLVARCKKLAGVKS